MRPRPPLGAASACRGRSDSLLPPLKGRADTFPLAQGLPAGGYAGRPRLAKTGDAPELARRPAGRLCRTPAGLVGARPAADPTRLPQCRHALAPAPLRGLHGLGAPCAARSPRRGISAGDPCRPRRLHGMPADPHGRAEVTQGRGGAVGGAAGAGRGDPACVSTGAVLDSRPANLAEDGHALVPPRPCASRHAAAAIHGPAPPLRCRSGPACETRRGAAVAPRTCCWPVLYRTRGMRTGAACPCGRARPCQARRGRMIRQAGPARRPVPAPSRCAGRAAAAGSRPPLACALAWKGAGRSRRAGRPPRRPHRAGARPPDGGAARAPGSQDPASA